jgi:dolichol-phosphate mannosyltransferase
VIDDDSPDGTWRLVADASSEEPRLHLLHRTTDRGRGAAGRDGFLRALELGADYVIEMDADFSHHPRYVPPMLARLAAGSEPGERPLGLVLGSRGVEGGADADRGFLRRLITRAANLYIRLLLGLTVRDCNSGFRAWRADTLRTIRVEDTFSKGPAIVQELLYKTARAKLAIAEVPIQFTDRERGESTLTMKILLQGYTTVLKLRLLSLFGRI